MIFNSGHVLVSCTGMYSDYNETILAFSLDKKKLEELAKTYNDEADDTRKRLEEARDEINDYMDKYTNEVEYPVYSDDREYMDNQYQQNCINTKKWVEKNPIPEKLKDFVEYWEREMDGMLEVQLRQCYESDYDVSYRVKSFGNV